jgi:Reverse transcriptase (RNA-dependent DNA polymerase)
VDDILLIGNDIPTLDKVKSSLKKVFSMKDLCETAYVLDIKIYRDRSQKLIGLSQGTYIDKVLKRFNMQDSKKKKTYPCHMTLISARSIVLRRMLSLKP